MFQPRKVKAAELMQDDRFRMGGQMYRIAQTDTNIFGEALIAAYPVTEFSPRMIQLILHPDTEFKIYNLIPE